MFQMNPGSLRSRCLKLLAQVFLGSSPALARGDATGTATAEPNLNKMSSGSKSFFYFVGQKKILVGFSSYSFCFNSLYMRSNLRCRRVTRLLSMFTSTARTDKMMEFLRLELIISRPVAVGCDTPSEPV